MIRAAAGLLSLLLTTLAAISVAAADKKIHIVAFGDSLTAGYQLPQSDAFPVQLQAALAQSKGIRFGSPMPAYPVIRRRAAWRASTGPCHQDTDAVILELGANDALRGVSPKIARENLDAILTKLATRNIPVLIAGMRAPANWGPEYVAEFDRIFGDLATEARRPALSVLHGGGHYAARSSSSTTPCIRTRPASRKSSRRILPDVERLIAKIRTAKAGN